MQYAAFVEVLQALLPAVGIWIVLFCSPLLPHMLENFVTGEPTTKEDLRLWLLQQDSWRLLQLYDCRWCQAFWTAVLASLLHTDLSLFWPLVIAWKTLTFYPITCFIVWKLSNLENN